MHKTTAIFLFVFTGLFLFCSLASAEDNLMSRAQGMFKPIPVSAPEIANNPATPEKLMLGKMLYFEPRLSKSALISCNTCHNVGMGGADFQETSVGHGWQKGGRNAPTVLNAVFNIAQFWDGRAPDLMDQAKGPVQASVEMSNTPEQVVKTLKSMPEYVALFMDKGCSSCHGGMNMGGSGYFPFGVVERPADKITAGDKGRFTFTGSSSDQYVFKSPSLRNIALTGPYFHSGRVWKLEDAVSIMGAAQLGITLTPEEAKKIEAFLRTATGIQPEVTYPILPAPTKDTPLPIID